MYCEQIFTDSPLRNFSYILYSEDRNKVFCIDPWDAEKISEYLKTKGLKLTHIINTHEHRDHTRGNLGLQERYQPHILAHEKAEGFIPCQNQGLKGGEKIAITDTSFLEVVDTPGHTFAHLTLLLHREKKPFAVFSGDTFFNAGVGNCHNGGDPEILYQTIYEYYRLLPDHLYVYPGHDYMKNNLGFTLRYESDNNQAKEMEKQYQKSSQVSTIGLEREINLFLRLDSPELRREIRHHFPNMRFEGSSSNLNKQFFLALRMLRDRW